MFSSEISSLRELEKTQTIRVPHPIGFVEGSKKTFYCVLEFVEIKALRKFASALGDRFADLHLHNENVAKNDPNFEYIDKFGFSQTTCVGLLPVDNTWSNDWPVRSLSIIVMICQKCLFSKILQTFFTQTFYTRRLEEQIIRLRSKVLSRWISIFLIISEL